MTLFLGPQPVCSALQWFSARGRLFVNVREVSVSYMDCTMADNQRLLQTGVLDDNRMEEEVDIIISLVSTDNMLTVK